MRTNRRWLASSSVGQSFTRFLQFNPAFVTALFLVAVLATFWNPRRPDYGFRLDRVVEVTGWLSRAPEIRGESVYFELSPHRVVQLDRRYSYPERIAVWVSSSLKQPRELFEPPLLYGEVLQFTAFLREPAYYAIPGVKDQRWLAWLGDVPFRVQLKSPAQLERLGQDWIGIFTCPFFHYLHRFEVHSQKVLSNQTFRLLLGVFLGRKRSLEDTERDSIRNLGLLHLFVVSGFHISLIVLLLHTVFRVLGRFGCLATVAGIWLYILGIGFPLAAVRAGIVASVAYFLVSFGLGRSLLNSLGISAIAIACLSPKNIFSASFHLSYICLCAIGLLALPCMKYTQAASKGIEDLQSNRVLLGRRNDLILRRRVRFSLESILGFVPCRSIRLLRKPLSQTISYILMLLLCSFCIQLLLFPVALHYTNRWSQTQVLANLLLMPLFSLLIALCLLFFFTFWTPVGSVFVWALEEWSEICHNLILGLASFSPVAFLPHPRWWEILIYIALILISCLALSGKAKVLTLVPPICLLLVPRQALSDVNELVITMLDVGQGESIHLRYPNGENGLIDAGGLSYPAQGNFVGERLVSRYLWHLGIRELLYLLVTHPDIDHKKGYSFIKKAFPISKLIYSEPQPDYEEPKQQVFAGDSFSVGEVRHSIHHPSISDLNQMSRNESSIVLSIQYGEFSMLFTGDIGSQVEHELLSRLTAVTALKLAHHGSNSSSSSDFLRVTRPRLAIVSAGRGDTFGHPSPSVLGRLERSGVQVFCTKNLGSVRLITDGYSLKIQHYSMESERFEDLYGPAPAGSNEMQK